MNNKTPAQKNTKAPPPSKPNLIEMPVDSAPEASHRWMLTFADLLALMLAFFILLYSMSIISAQQWEKMMRSLAHQLNPQFADDQTDYTEEKAIERIIEQPAIDLDYLNAILQEKMLQDPVLAQNIRLIKGDGKLSIIIASNNLFNKNDSSLTENAQLVLYGVGNVLQSVPNKIEIFANSDEGALQASEYPSHWELSLSRAMIVGEMLRKFGNSSIIKAFGRANPTYGTNPSERKAPQAGLNQAGISSIEVAIRRTVKDDDQSAQ